jgi:GcrA cell cycle regulator
MTGKSGATGAGEGTGMSWTEERIEKLTKMWEGGATASQIAEELGGVSRNAVIGKAHRLGLKARPSPVKPNDKQEAPRVEAAPKPAPRAVAPAEPRAAPARPAPAPVLAAATPPSPPLRAATPPPAPASTAPAAAAPNGDAPVAPAAPQPRIVSVGPGGFLRQGPGDQQAPIPPAPPRRLVPARPSPEIAEKTSLLDLNDRICRWPVGHPGEPDFHFCGEKVNPGFPYCVDHCGRAYQAQLPRGHRRPPPPMPFGGPRVR